MGPNWVALFGALLLGCAVMSARVPGGMFGDISSDAFPSGLKAVQGSVASVLRAASTAATGDDSGKGKGGDDEDEGKDKGDEYDERAYAAIRFTVPPSEGEDFEDEWLKLEKRSRKYHGKNLEIFDLKKTVLDNLFYLSYSEFSDHKEFLDHLHSDHFLDFAEYVDEAGIKWELQILKNLSEDLDEEHGRDDEGDGDNDIMVGSDFGLTRRRRRGHGEQPEQPEQGGDSDWDKNIPDQYKPNIPDQYLPKHKDKKSDRKSGSSKRSSRRHGKRVSEVSTSALAAAGLSPFDSEDTTAVTALREQLMKKKGLYHVLIYYIVRPGEAEGFIKEWTTAAQATIEGEKGNRIYALRKIASDNTQFYVYGTWESFEDYVEHYKADYTKKLLQYNDKNDIVYFIAPLEKIGNQDE